MWKDIVRIGKTPEEFANAVKAALAESNPEATRQRLAIAADHTWDKLGARLSQLLEKSFTRDPKAIESL
jgi:hypothetical protein